MGVISFRRGSALIEADGSGGGGGAAFPTLTGLLFRYDAANTSQPYEQVNQTFSPSAVDTSANKLMIAADLKFPTNTGTPSYGTPVYFTSTGTLPTGLLPNTKYYIVGTQATGYTVYPEQRANDYLNIPGAMQQERPYMSGQNVWAQVNAIDFVDQGTGTHTIYTDKLLSQVNDLSPNAFHCYTTSATNRHYLIENGLDPTGKPCYISRQHAQNNVTSSGNKDGKNAISGVDNADDQAFRNFVSGKRWIAFTWAGSFYSNYLESYPKTWVRNGANMVSGSVITNRQSNGTTTLAHLLATGNMLKCVPTNNKALPPELTQGTAYYARAITSTTFSIHPTAADATANTNAISPTMGSGVEFIVYASQRVGDVNQEAFLINMYAPANGSVDNICSPRLRTTAPAGQGKQNIASTFLQGGTNGRVSQGFKQNEKVWVWFPEDAVRPVRLDNGQPLATGFYWASTRTGETGTCRLHDSLASAQANAEVAVASASCIKYSFTGVAGEVLFQYGDGSGIIISNTPFDTNPGTIHSLVTTRLLPNTPLIYTMLIDYNDPTATNTVMKLYLNGALIQSITLSGTKQNMPLNDGAPGSILQLFGDTNTHVAFTGWPNIYVCQAGSSDPVDSEFTGLHNWINTSWNITGRGAY